MTPPSFPQTSFAAIGNGAPQQSGQNSMTLMHQSQIPTQHQNSQPLPAPLPRPTINPPSFPQTSFAAIGNGAPQQSGQNPITSSLVGNASRDRSYVPTVLLSHSSALNPSLSPVGTHTQSFPKPYPLVSRSADGQPSASQNTNQLSCQEMIQNLQQEYKCRELLLKEIEYGQFITQSLGMLFTIVEGLSTSMPEILPMQERWLKSLSAGQSLSNVKAFNYFIKLGLAFESLPNLPPEKTKELCLYNKFILAADEILSNSEILFKKGLGECFHIVKELKNYVSLIQRLPPIESSLLLQAFQSLSAPSESIIQSLLPQQIEISTQPNIVQSSRQSTHDMLSNPYISKVIDSNLPSLNPSSSLAVASHSLSPSVSLQIEISDQPNIIQPSRQSTHDMLSNPCISRVVDSNLPSLNPSSSLAVPSHSLSSSASLQQMEISDHPNLSLPSLNPSSSLVVPSHSLSPSASLQQMEIFAQPNSSLPSVNPSSSLVVPSHSLSPSASLQQMGIFAQPNIIQSSPQSTQHILQDPSALLEFPDDQAVKDILSQAENFQERRSLFSNHLPTELAQSYYWLNVIVKELPGNTKKINKDNKKICALAEKFGTEPVECIELFNYSKEMVYFCECIAKEKKYNKKKLPVYFTYSIFMKWIDSGHSLKTLFVNYEKDEHFEEICGLIKQKMTSIGHLLEARDKDKIEKRLREYCSENLKNRQYRAAFAAIIYAISRKDCPLHKNREGNYNEFMIKLSKKLENEEELFISFIRDRKFLLSKGISMRFCNYITDCTVIPYSTITEKIYDQAKQLIEYIAIKHNEKQLKEFLEKHHAKQSTYENRLNRLACIGSFTDDDSEIHESKYKKWAQRADCRITHWLNTKKSLSRYCCGKDIKLSRMISYIALTLAKENLDKTFRQKIVSACQTYETPRSEASPFEDPIPH